MYHYTESGLQNVWLMNGYKTKKTPYGDAVAIINAEGLHRMMGRYLCSKGHMTGAEFRFLRKELDLSQTRLGMLLGYSEEAVSLWERKGRIPKGARILMQAMYLGTIDGDRPLKQTIEHLADLDRDEMDKVVFEDTQAGWREAA